MSIPFDKQDLAMKLNMINGLDSAIKLENIEWAERMVAKHNKLSAKIDALKHQVQQAQARRNNLSQKYNMFCSTFEPKATVSNECIRNYAFLKDADKISRNDAYPAFPETFVPHIDVRLKMLCEALNGNLSYLFKRLQSTSLQTVAESQIKHLSNYRLFRPSFDREHTSPFHNTLVITGTGNTDGCFDTTLIMDTVKNIMIRALQDFTMDDLRGRLTKDQAFDLMQSVHALRLLIRGEASAYRSAVEGSCLIGQHPINNLLLMAQMRVVPVFFHSEAAEIANWQSGEAMVNSTEKARNSRYLQSYTDSHLMETESLSIQTPPNRAFSIALLIADPARANKEYDKFNAYDGQLPLFDLGGSFNEYQDSLMSFFGQHLSTLAKYGFSHYKQSENTVPYQDITGRNRVSISNLQPFSQ